MPLNLVADIIDDTARPALPAQAASEADHRIANNLMIIAGLIRRQAARLPAEPTLPTEKVRDWFEEMSLRIDAVGRLHALPARCLSPGNPSGRVLPNTGNLMRSPFSLSAGWSRRGRKETA